MKKILAIFLNLVLVLCLAACGSNSEVPQPSQEPTPTVVPSENIVTTNETETITPEPTTSYNFYPEGMYKVGEDIPAGEYYIEQTGTFDGYFCISSDSNGEDILENENFGHHTFAELKEGEYFEFKRSKAILSGDVQLLFDANALEEGTYRVGIDIPAGEYKLTLTGTIDGYLCIYDNCSSERNIIKNSNFSGQKYVGVSDGQYLMLKRCTGALSGEASEKNLDEALLSVESFANMIATANNNGTVICITSYTDDSVTVNITLKGMDKVIPQFEGDGISDDGTKWDDFKNAVFQYYAPMETLKSTFNLDVEIVLNLSSDTDDSVAYVTWVDGIETYDVFA